MKKLLTIGTLGVSLSIAAYGVQQSARTDREWKQLATEGLEFEHEANASAGSRRVLRDTPVEGIAMVEYDRAMDLLHGSFDSDWTKYQAGGPEERTILRAKILESNRQLLKTISSGALMSRARAPFDWDNLSGNSPVSLSTARSAVNIITLAAVESMVDDRQSAAVDQLLDGLQFSVDVMRGPYKMDRFTGGALLRIVCHEILKHDVLNRLSKNQVVRLQKGMTIADEDFPDLQDAWNNDLAMIIRGVTTNPPSSWRETLDDYSEFKDWISLASSTPPSTWPTRVSTHTGIVLPTPRHLDESYDFSYDQTPAAMALVDYEASAVFQLTRAVADYCSDKDLLPSMEFPKYSITTTRHKDRIQFECQIGGLRAPRGQIRHEVPIP